VRECLGASLPLGYLIPGWASSLTALFLFFPSPLLLRLLLLLLLLLQKFDYFWPFLIILESAYCFETIVCRDQLEEI
jgi:hypothetical protein